MDAKYFPIEIEEKWSKVWAERELNKPETAQNFSQIIPPAKSLTSQRKPPPQIM